MLIYFRTTTSQTLPIPRVSEDKFTNQNGNLLIDFCKESGLRILNGRVGLDGSVGKYTFVGTLGNSVVDYVLASHSLFKLCHSFEVKQPNILSDHCAVEFSIITNNILHNINDDSNERRQKRLILIINGHLIKRIFIQRL